MAYSVKCPLCGTVLEGDSEDKIVEVADAHGNSEHGMTAPREMILAQVKQS